MGFKSKLLAPIFVIAAIVVAYSPLRAIAQETSGITKISDAVQVPEGLTTEISARASGGGARSVSHSSGGSRSVGRSSGGSRSVGRSSGGGKKVSSGKTGSGKSAGSGKNKKTKTGSSGTGKTGTGKTAGTGKTGTGKTGTGKTGTGKIGGGPGKKGTGSKTGQGKNGTGKIGTGPGKKGTGSKVGAGPGKGGPGRINKGPYVNINVNRGPYRLWRGNRWVTFVGFGTLAAILVGADYYDPYGYVAIARPYCEGFTDDGCQLRWQTVALEEDGDDWQCVQFCPRVRVGVTPVPVPAAAAPAVDLSAQAAGTCEVVIYAEPNMAGTSTPTSENQPRLVDVGWKDEIASIEVKSGTWDFYTGDDYAGDTMRLAPGTYGQLAPDWTKHISSFQCSNPS
ncbi:MAG TPA: beta/gamma crystallin-related protein [Pseudolabrys sp.]|jgi:hypothetical protein